jgi:hypothetical protein
VADPLRCEDVGVVEVGEEVVEVGVTIGHDRRLDPVEDLAWHALRVVVGPQQEQRDHADERGLAHPG